MKTTPTPETIRLRSDVENKLGFEVTCTRDCIILSQELKRFDQRFSLSVSTLRRFFGIIKQNNPTSYTSLNALARYTGAPSYDKWNDYHFRKINKKGKKTSEIFKDEITFKDFDTSKEFDTRPETITSSIQIINEILNLVEKKETFQLSPQKLREINKLTYNLIKIDAYPNEVWKRLNRIPRARIFTEAFPPIDYLDGIGEVYMKDYLATSSTEEERMFATSLIASGTIYTGSKLKSAEPSFAVEILGLSTVPDAGETFQVVKNDKEAREIAEFRESKLKDRKVLKQRDESLGNIRGPDGGQHACQRRQ